MLGLAAAAALPSARADEIDDYVQKQMGRRHIPGVSVAVVKGGEVVKLKGYGLANIETNTPATEETVYQLASVTKTFTATAVVMLSEEGKFGLDDKIAAHLKDLPDAWKEVTIRQLLNHTSGIKSYTSIPSFHETPRKDFPRLEIIDLVAKAPLEFAPGAEHRYSNTGYFLLGLLIEEASGKPYGEFMAERIFQPLGMSRTRANDHSAIIPGRAHGYSWDGKELKNGEYVSPSQPYAAGMLTSTVADMLKWDAALASGKLLGAQTLEGMWAPAQLSGGEKAGYGLGWQTSEVNGHRLISHGGGIDGFSTNLSRFVDDKLTVIVLANAGGVDVGRLAQGIAGIAEPKLAKKREEPIADDNPEQTERLLRAVRGAMKGEIDPELFTKGAAENLGPRIKEDKDRHAQFGELKSLQLLERKSAEPGTRVRYRAIFEKETLNAMFGLDGEGKIAGLGLMLED